MREFKFLIDTNIVIGLEDDRTVDRAFAELSRLCSQHGIRLFIHDAVSDDICRDKDVKRREIILSKLAKFERLRSLPNEDRHNLSAKFGNLPKINDFCDARLINVLDSGAVDFLISEDRGLNKRAARAGLDNNVLNVQEALTWIESFFERRPVELPHVVDRKAHEIPQESKIFDTLREDYPEFDNWFRNKCISEHRDCWTIELNEEIAGIVIRHDEDRATAGTLFPGDRVLKICTFKMQSEYRGEKFGELLLKKILWFAQLNNYDVVYLTAFPKQKSLITLLEYYGFRETEVFDSGELRFERKIYKGDAVLDDGQSAFEFARLYYPRYYDGNEVEKYCIPIKGKFHRSLFPEIAKATELPLLPSEVHGTAYATGHTAEKTPGNTIRKVYICSAKIKEIPEGSILLFYMSKDSKFQLSQSITTIGVAEAITDCGTIEELSIAIGKRSVFRENELEGMMRDAAGPLKVIDFLILEHLEDPLSSNILIATGVFNNRPPQSICRLDEERYQTFKQLRES